MTGDMMIWWRGDDDDDDDDAASDIVDGVVDIDRETDDLAILMTANWPLKKLVLKLKNDDGIDDDDTIYDRY